MSGTTGVKGSLSALADTFRNPNLRRLQLAWVGSILGTWSYLVALSVYAYGQGGATAVGIVGVIKLVPAALLAPFVAGFADRFSRRGVMIASDVARAALFVAAAAVIAVDGPPAVVYTLVAIAVVTGTAFRPAQAALLPSLARTPNELTAANVASTTWESIGGMFGPAVGGLLLAATNVEAVFVFNAATFVWSALLLLAMKVPREEEQRERRSRTSLFGKETLDGFRLLWRDRRLGTLVAVYSVQMFVAGALGVLLVVVALDLLDMGDAGVGWLNAALGAGGVLGGLVALALAGRGRLARDVAVGLVLFGVPMIVLGVAPSVAVALAALVFVGIGSAIVDVGSITLLQRNTPDEVMGRVFGVNQSLMILTFGLGALAAPALVGLVGTEGALIATGALLPVLAIVSAPVLRRLDLAAAPAETAVLRSVPFFASLPEPTLERLAASMREVRATAGEVVIREGGHGDLFYVVQQGELEVEGKTLGEGDYFGEIALLHDVPRTATVTATTDVVLQALPRDEFLEAVTGDDESHAVASSVVALRLGDTPA